MRLNEIKLNIPPITKTRSFEPKNQKARVLGRGIQTIAYVHRKFPNAVLRVTGLRSPEESAVQFLRVCINHKDNPFLPKVYAFKIYHTQDLTPEDKEYLEGEGSYLMSQARYYLVSVVEKLSRADDIGDDSIITALRNMGCNVGSAINDDAIVNMFDYAGGRSKVMASCNNKQFKDAMRLLEPLFMRFMPDLHDGNFMFRGTQLVINDPVV